MAAYEILISALPGEMRIAYTQSGRLVEIDVVRDDIRSTIGNIYHGRVVKVMGSIESAFVDIGAASAGFLPLSDARSSDRLGGEDSITDYAGEGDALIVQVTKDAFDDKGPRLSRRVTLGGRCLVLTPGQTGVRLSRRIERQGEGERLLSLMHGIANKDEGFILRTGSIDVDADDLADDAGLLRAAWSDVKAAAQAGKPPALLSEAASPLRRTLTDAAHRDVNRIIIDHGETYSEARVVLKSVQGQRPELEHYRSAEPLFEAMGIEEQIDEALSPKIALPGGGSIVIDELTALTAIDVNTGGTRRGGGAEQAARLTNIEAVPEIARQICLRNIGGHILVDFVSMRRRHHGAEVLDALKAAMESDTCAVHIAGFTRLGLVEIRRERRKPSLLQTMSSPCSGCAGSGRAPSPLTAAFNAIRRLQSASRSSPAIALSIKAAPVVIEALRGPAGKALVFVTERLGYSPVLRVDESYEVGRVEITPALTKKGVEDA